WNLVSATSWATLRAAWGGQIESTTSLSLSALGRVPTSIKPACSARCRVASPRPCDAQITRAPPALAAAPIVAPMLPGCNKATVLGFIAIPPAFKLPGSLSCGQESGAFYLHDLLTLALRVDMPAACSYS